MKDFKSVLKIFGDKIDSMDFCDDFQRIESIFRYFDKYIKPLEKIHHKGGKLLRFLKPFRNYFMVSKFFFFILGNEPYINDITTKIRQFLYSKNYVTDENQPNPLYDKELRKITFFLILNTNVSWKYDLTNDQTICHLIGILPKIPKCILLACIWDLNLSEYFYECISYSAGWLSLPIIDGAVDSLKYADAYQSLERVEKMVKAIYILIARYDYRQTASTKIEHKIMLSKFYDYTADFLRHFFTPDAEKFDKMTKFQFTIYKGYVLKHILHLILNCFEIYRKKPSFIIDEHLQIFQLMEDKEKTFDSNSSNYCATVDEILHKINITLLNSLQSSVMDVDVGTFTDWVEEDLDNDNDNETLQSAIGNAVYKVLQQISANDCFKHDVSKQLINLAIKPKTIQERAKESLLGDIIRKLDSKVLAGNERNVWLTEFLNRGALVFENDECMDTLKDNMEYLTFEHCQLILKYISSKNIDDDNAQSDNDNDNDDDEITNLNVIINKAMKKCNCKEIEEICAMIIDLKITICLKPNTFDKCLIEVFNKGTLTFYNQTDLCIMAQNPQVFFDRLFEYSYQNAQQLETFISFIRSASIVSAKLLPNCVANLFENKFAELTPTEENTIPPLMTELYCSNILSKDFITKLLYKMIMNSLEKNDWRKIIIILRILLRIVGRNDFGLINEPVIVVMVGQVLDKCRWDMTRYCEELEIIVCKSIEFIQEATKKFLPKANDIGIYSFDENN